MIGRVNSFHSFSTNDGPGIRAVIFMQGCPLRCKCCHNPETWYDSGGTDISIDDLMFKILRGKDYYQNGGVTISGGEPLMQASFVLELVKRCRAEGLHVAIDTSGCMLGKDVVEILSHVDLVLLDIKKTTEAEYQDFAKGSLASTIKFLKTLDDMNIKTWIRHVIVKDVDDDKDKLVELAKILEAFKCIEAVDFLGFKRYCDSKYQELGVEFPLKNAVEPTDLELEEINIFYRNINKIKIKDNN